MSSYLLLPTYLSIPKVETLFQWAVGMHGGQEIRPGPREVGEWIRGPRNGLNSSCAPSSGNQIENKYPAMQDEIAGTIALFPLGSEKN